MSALLWFQMITRTSPTHPSFPLPQLKDYLPSLALSLFLGGGLGEQSQVSFFFVFFFNVFC